MDADFGNFKLSLRLLKFNILEVAIKETGFDY